jgi:hypothetical protein
MKAFEINYYRKAMKRRAIKLPLIYRSQIIIIELILTFFWDRPSLIEGKTS